MSTDTMAPMTTDVIAAFFGPLLDGSSNGDLAEVARRYAPVTVERTVESR
jgi:hypothetical protein